MQQSTRPHLKTTLIKNEVNDDTYKNEEDKEKINTLDSNTVITKPKSNKWMRWLARRRRHKLTIDSGAISNFV